MVHFFQSKLACRCTTPRCCVFASWEWFIDTIETADRNKKYEGHWTMHSCFRCWSKINRYISFPAFSFSTFAEVCWAILALCHGRLGHPEAHGCHGRLAGSTPLIWFNTEETSMYISRLIVTLPVHQLTRAQFHRALVLNLLHPGLPWDIHIHSPTLLPAVIVCLELIHGRSVKHHKWLVIPNL